MYLHETEIEFPVNAGRCSILQQVASGISQPLSQTIVRTCTAPASSIPESGIPESVAIGPNRK